MSARQIERTTNSFRSSWIDRVMDAVERWPVPYWLVYTVFFLLEVLIFHWIGWQDGWVKRYTLEPINFLFPIWMFGPLLAMTYLDGVARQSLHDFASLLDDSPEDLDRLESEFTQMPPGPVLAIGLIWLGVYALMMLITFPAFLEQYGVGPFASIVSGFIGLITFPVGGVLYYHSTRQLRLVSQTVKRVQKFNVFQLDPVYAFSRLTSQTGLVWLFMLTLTQLVFPITLLSFVSISLYVIMVLLVVAAFVLPLWSVHHRLEAEKRRLLSEANQRLEDKLQRMHRSLDADHLDELDALRQAVGGILDEREILSKIPTWPWRSSTIAGFGSALILPIVLALIQIALERLIK